MKVLIACEFSGIIREAFARRGHEAWSADLLDTEIPSSFHYKGDVREILGEGWELMIAHPPCDHLAVSGARYFEEKRRDGRQQAALAFVQELMDAPIDKICIENPVSIISTHIRKASQWIQPYQFGHGESKRTGLWLKNLPLLEPTNIVEGREQKVWWMAPSKDRWKNRSRTYTGIAEAMATQWG